MRTYLFLKDQDEDDNIHTKRKQILEASDSLNKKYKTSEDKALPIQK